MPDNHRQYLLCKLFDHIMGHVAATSGIQGILNFRPNAKKLPIKALLPDSWKPWRFFCCFTIFILPRWQPAKVEYGWCFFSFLWPLKWVTSLSCSTNSCLINQQFWLHWFFIYFLLASSCSCVKMFLQQVINVLGLYRIPSILLSHFLSVGEPFPMCVIVGMLRNKLCLHVICTLTN